MKINIVSGSAPNSFVVYLYVFVILHFFFFFNVLINAGARRDDLMVFKTVGKPRHSTCIILSEYPHVGNRLLLLFN